MPASPRIAVVGAGPAGLTAAHALARGGASVTVFEAADAVGGKTRTYAEGGFRVDPATQLFGNVYTHFLRVLREAGAAHLCVRTAGRDALWRKGKAHEVVYGSTASMLTSGALPFGLKLKMGAKYLPYLHHHADALDLHALEKAARAGLDGESAAAWGVREIGRDFVDLLAHPLLTTLYGATPEETSAGFYHSLARQGTVLQVVALRGGSGAFCDAVAAALAAAGGAVRTGTAVRAVRPSADGVEVAGDGWSEAFDGCIVAVPAAAARALVGEVMPVAGEWLAGVRGRPAATLAIALDRPVGARYFGLSFARGESRSVAAACVEECKLPDRVPPGKGLLVVFPYPEAAARMMEMEADDALALLLPDLRRPFPGLEAAITGTRLYRFPHGWTVFYPGYLAHLGRFRAGAVEGDRRIALAGDYLRAPNVEGAVTSGLAAARRLLERLGGGRGQAAAADQGTSTPPHTGG